MRGTRQFRRERNGVGGFTEAVLALMVVTIAVILLSAAFSLTSIEVLRDGDDASLSDACDGLFDDLKDDDLLWNGGAIVTTSFGERSLRPYPLADGLFGYEIALYDLSDSNNTSSPISNGTEVEGTDVHADRYPVLIRDGQGRLVAGLIEIRVW